MPNQNELENKIQKLEKAGKFKREKINQLTTRKNKLEEANEVLERAWIEQGRKNNEDIKKIRAEVEEKNREIITTLNQRKIDLENELKIEKEEAVKSLQKAQEWRERQLKEATEKKDKEKAEAIRNLERKELEKRNQLTAEKTAAIQKLEAEKNSKIRELNVEHQKTLANLGKTWKQKEQELTTKISELEKTKEQIKQQVLQERTEAENKLRNKVNSKLEKGGWFTPNTRGGDLEQATDNLLEKQQQLENQITNLRKEIWQTITKLAEEKENHQKEKDKLTVRISQALNRKKMFNSIHNNLEEAIDELIGNEILHTPSTSDKCLSVVTAPFRWVANKTSTGFALVGFGVSIPAICGAIGWGIKAFLAVKTGGVGGAVMVADSLIKQSQKNKSGENNNQGGNLPPNYQPLPDQQNNYSPPAEKTPNLPPVINNHYHNLPAGKQENNRRNRKKKRTDNF